MIEEDDLTDVFFWLCLKRGYKVQFGRKILQPNEQRPADYDHWLQCPRCYNLCPIHEAAKDETIKDTIETQDNPFEDKFQSVSVPTRAAEKGRKPRAKKIRKNKNKLHEDPEIDALMKRHGDRMKIVHDSGTNA
jgi:hypothetical protein